MITKLGVLFIFLLPLSVRADAVSIEVFKKLTGEEQGRAIAQAPPEQQDELRKVAKHLRLLQVFQNEEGVKIAREKQVAGARGVKDIEWPFIVQEMMWNCYAGQKTSEGATAGLKGRRLVAAEEKLIAKQKAKTAVIRARQLVVHQLAFRLAPTPEALALAKQAKKLTEEMQKRVTSDGTTPIQSITNDEQAREQARIDERVDTIWRIARTLPKLSVGQAEREYEAFTEDKVFDGGPNG